MKGIGSTRLGFLRRYGHVAVDQNPVNPVLSSPPLPPPGVTYPFVAACCYIPLSRMLGTGRPHERTLSQRHLSQARIFCYKPIYRAMAVEACYKPSVFSLTAVSGSFNMKDHKEYIQNQQSILHLQPCNLNISPRSPQSLKTRYYKSGSSCQPQRRHVAATQVTTLTSVK